MGLIWTAGIGGVDVCRILIVSGWSEIAFVSRIEIFDCGYCCDFWSSSDVLKETRKSGACVCIRSNRKADNGRLVVWIRFCGYPSGTHGVMTIPGVLNLWNRRNKDLISDRLWWGWTRNVWGTCFLDCNHEAAYNKRFW